MADPLSITYGIAIAIGLLLAAYGLYAAGQHPDHMVDMREVAAYYRHKNAEESLSDDDE